MGATFSEGAIMQHIAKLRGRMAELNVAPVPDPPRRGQITSKPSSVYTSKTRGLPPPPPPPPSKASARQTRRTGTINAVGSSPAKSRSQRSATNRRIKRSSSDPADSEHEFEGDDSEYSNTRLNANGKRQRRAYRRKTNTTHDSSQELGMSRTESIMQSLAEADARFEAEHGDDPDNMYVQDQPLFTTPSMTGSNSTFATASPIFHPNLLTYPGCAETIGEDEVEEEVRGLLPTSQANANRFNSGGGGGFSFFPGPSQYSQDGQVSPTSTIHAVSVAITTSIIY